MWHVMDVGWQTGFEHWTIYMWLMWHRTWTPKIKHDSGIMWNHFFPEVPLEPSFANWSNVSSGANKWGHWFRHKNTSDALQAQFVKCALSLLDDDCSQRPGFSWVRWKVSVSQIHEKRTCSGSGCHRGIQSSASHPYQRLHHLVKPTNQQVCCSWVMFIHSAMSFELLTFHSAAFGSKSCE